MSDNGNQAAKYKLCLVIVVLGTIVALIGGAVVDLVK